MPETTAPPRPLSPAPKPWIRYGIIAVGLGLPVVAAVALRLSFGSYVIPAGSMLPTILVGDHILVRHGAGAPPERGEVIVFAYPEDPTKDFVKRAIALPGDRLEVIDGRPIVNGFLLPHCHVGEVDIEGKKQHLYVEFAGNRSYGTLHDEPTLDKACHAASDCGTGEVCAGGTCGRTLQGPFVAKSGEVWVLGDNRDNSFDSRFWHGGLGGGVPLESIAGSARVTFLSTQKPADLAADRFWTGVQGPPLVTKGSALDSALAKCLSSRPPASQTTPPGP
jgi:signal peptidase I